MIVLDLDTYDEPQAIFETLNAHGTPLLPADLIKNWLLWEAGKQGQDATTLYSANWAQFDKGHEYWRKVVGTGHAARPRVDTYLQNWLTLETGETISAKHIYDKFLAHVASQAGQSEHQRIDLPFLMDKLKSDAARYRVIDESDLPGEVGERIRRLNRLDYVVFRPFLIGLLRHIDAEPQLVADCVAALESFLVRRMVCGEQTRAYGKLAVDLVVALRAAGDWATKRSAVIDVLNETGWPDDERFKHFWLKSRFYRWFRQARVLTLLQAMELKLQADAVKSEKLVIDVEGLTIEHVMPQTWQTHWPLPDGTDPMTRDALVQNIGNLTLVNDRLNPSLSNGPWSSGTNPKRHQLGQHSKLELNRHLLELAGETWDDDSIVVRAEQLFDVAKSVWPSAATLEN
jgi:hypothetical protein